MNVVLAHGERTGVRFVLTNVTDPSHADDYSAWYDDYENAIVRPGVIANAFRFENPDAAGTATDPRYAAIYDLVTCDPASAWPATENSPSYPTQLFADPRSKLVAPALRGSYGLTGSMETANGPRTLTGVHVILSDGGNDAVREQLPAFANEVPAHSRSSRPTVSQARSYGGTRHACFARRGNHRHLHKVRVPAARRRLLRPGDRLSRLRR